MDIEKAKMMSLDMTQENTKKIQALFPNAVTEVIGEDGKVKLAVDFDVLKQELSDSLIDEKQERYQTTWPDKKNSMILSNQSIMATLRPVEKNSIDFNSTRNVYIEGDNLDVLKLLRETYLEKIEMIYIDPPYNTGGDTFVYNDSYSLDEEDFLKAGGYYDSDGNRVVNAKLSGEDSGRFHTEWLNMMYPRLRIAKDLLSEDGVIFASIDSGEVDNLKKLFNEVFGERNFLGMVARRAKTTSFRGNFFAPRVDYILVYSKNISNVRKFRGEVDSSQYTKIETDGPRKGEYYGDDTAFYLSTLQTRPNQRYFIECPDGELVIPPGTTLPTNKVDGEKVLPNDGDGVWRWEQKQYLNKKFYLSFKKTSTSPLLNQDGQKAHWNIYTKIYLNDKENDANIPEELFLDFINRQSAKELDELDIPFEFAKPVSLIKYLIKILDQRKDITVLDFFSGSATTAHAVMQLNSEDGGNRKYILVQLPEKCNPDSDASRKGYETITEIGEERIRRAGKKIKNESGILGSELDVGFRVFRLDSSNMNEVYYNPKAMTQNLLEATVDNVKPDRTPLDLLFQVMLECGALLSSKIEEKTINGKKIFVVEDNYIAACFDDDLDDKTIEEIAKLHPVYACFKGSSFNTDSANINAEQIFKTYSPNTEKVKAI